MIIITFLSVSRHFFFGTGSGLMFFINPFSIFKFFTLFPVHIQMLRGKLETVATKWAPKMFLRDSRESLSFIS